MRMDQDNLFMSSKVAGGTKVFGSFTDKDRGMGEESNVRSLDWYRKHGTRKDEEPKDDAELTFEEISKRNAANEDRVRKERERHNKNLVRNFRLTNKKKGS